MINREHDLAITKQAKVLRVRRGSVYYLPRGYRKLTLQSCDASTGCI
jgi:hypothetical protein